MSLPHSELEEKLKKAEQRVAQYRAIAIGSSTITALVILLLIFEMTR